jgi:hypothetical protein
MNLIGSVVIAIAIAISGFHDGHYTYVDGSANSYEVTPTSVQYIPIKPENSSSGTYDGGEERTVAIDSATFSGIDSLFTDAIKDTSSHIKNRIKGSGMILYFDSGTEKSIILRSGSKSKNNLEQVLSLLIKG